MASILQSGSTILAGDTELCEWIRQSKAQSQSAYVCGGIFDGAGALA